MTIQTYDELILKIDKEIIEQKQSEIDAALYKNDLGIEFI
jgi:hypothetical protein